MKKFYSVTNIAIGPLKHLVARMFGLLVLTFSLLSVVAQAQTITGVVYNDGNANGTKDATEIGYPYVTVKAFDNAGTVVATTTTTDQTGTYTLSGLTTGQPYRVEFSLPGGFSDGPSPAGGKTSVQFVTAPATGIDFGVYVPTSIAVDRNPLITAGCAPIGGSTTFISFKYLDRIIRTGAGIDAALNAHKDHLTTTQTGTPFQVSARPGTKQSYFSVIGAWGLAYFQPGPNGNDAIYVADFNGPAATNNGYTDYKVLTKLATLGISVTAVNPVSAEGANNQSFGSFGVGGLTFSEDGKYLYVVNLGKRNLARIDVSGVNFSSLPTTAPTASNVLEIALPVTCAGGFFRPTAVKHYGGKIYIAGVCDGSTSSNKADLLIKVLAMDPATNAFVEVLSYRPNFQAGTWASHNTIVNTWKAPTGADVQPFINDLTFDDMGALILGVNTRDAYSSVGLGSFLLRTSRNADGSFTMENAGVSGPFTSAARTPQPAYSGYIPGNEAPSSTTLAIGPGNKWFFEQGLISSGVFHFYTYLGGTFVLPGSSELIAGYMDPIFSTTTGARYFNWQTGTAFAGSNVTNAKQWSLTGFDAIGEPNPIEIGNRIWGDKNGDGVQGADTSPTGEPGLAGIPVELRNNATNTLIASVTTNSAGNYLFSGAVGTSTPSFAYNLSLVAGTTYKLVFPTQYNGQPLTTPTSTSGNGNSLNDSDADASGIVLYQAKIGEQNHTLDAGFLTAVQPVDIGVTKVRTSAQQSTVGGVVSFQVVAKNNSATQATNVVVSDLLGAADFGGVAGTPSQGVYTVGTGVWNVGTLSAGASATLTVTATVLREGISYNTASLSSVTEGDTNPNNDIDRACVTVPVALTGNQTYTATVPAQYSAVQWFKDGVATVAGNVYVINTSGVYTFTASNGGCAGGTCCPLIVQKTNVCSLTATASASSQTVAQGQPVTLTAQATPAGSYTYAWAGSGTITPTNAATVTASNLATGLNTFTVTVTSAPGCFTTATVSVSVIASPVIAVTVTPGVCQSATNQYSISGALSLTNAVAGTATITDGTATTTVAITDGATSVPFTLGGFNSGTGLHTVTVTYTSLTTSTTYTPPTSCTVIPCSLTVTASAKGANGTPSICAGQSVTLTAQASPVGSYTYVWSGPSGIVISNGNTATATASISATGVQTFTVTVSSSPTCSTTATVTVQVNPPTTLPTFQPTVLCEGGSVNFSITPPAGASAYWTTPTNTTISSGTVSIASATTVDSGTYTLYYTNASGCTSSTTKPVTVNAKPTISLVNSGCVSGNQSYTVLVSTNAASLTTNGASVGVTISGNLITVPIAVTSFTVTATSAAGCTTTLPVVAPTCTTTCTPPNPGPDQTLCEGTTSTTLVSPGAGEQWSVAAQVVGSNPVINQSGVPVTVSGLTVPGVYKFRLVSTSVTNCSAVVTVTVNPKTVLPVYPPATLCEGQGLSFGVNVPVGASAYWTTPTNTTISSGTVTIANATTANAGIYTLTYINATGCVSTATKSLTVNVNPTLTLVSSGCISGNQSYTALVSTNATSLTTNAELAGVVRNGNLFSAPISVVSFIISASSASGCVVTLPVTAPSCSTICTTPNPGPDQTLCEGTTSTTLVSPGAGEQWSVAAQVVGSNPVINQSGVPVTVSGLTVPGVYKFRLVSTSVSNCSAVVTVTVNPKTTLPTYASSTICESSNFTFSISPTAGASAYWTTPTNTTVSSGTVTIANATTANAGVYTLVYTNATGCVSTATKTLVVSPLPTLSLVAGSLSCVSGGQSYTALLSTNAASVTTNAASFSVTINGNVITAPSTVALFTVTATSTAGCFRQIDITKPVCPTVCSLTATALASSSTLTQGQSVSLSAQVSPVGSYTVNWSGPAGVTLTPAVGVVVASGLPTGVNTFTVTATGAPGCFTTATVSVTVLPPALTVSVTPGACQSATNQYSVSGTLSLTNAITGTATITDGTATTTVAITAGATSIPYTFAGLPSGSGSHTVTVSYAGQTASTTYIAPLSCTIAFPASLGDFVWYDTNGNGQQDASEPGVPGVTVKLFDPTSSTTTPIAILTTDANGKYLFTNLTPGVYCVIFDKTTLPAGYTLTTANVGPAATDSDANPVTGKTANYTLAAGQQELTVDAGIVPPARFGSIGDYVWKDNNNNGLQDTNEPGVSGVTVQLFTVVNGISSSTPVATTVTNTSGLYGFGNLPSGQYQVKFTIPASLTDVCQITDKVNAGTDRTRDSDVNPVTGLSPVITIDVTQPVSSTARNNPTIDLGLQQRIYDPIGFIYCYQNNTILKGGTIRVTGPGSVIITKNGLDGAYQFFTDGTPGSYTMTYSHPSGYSVATAQRPVAYTVIDPTHLEGYNAPQKLDR